MSTKTSAAAAHHAHNYDHSRHAKEENTCSSDCVTRGRTEVDARDFATNEPSTKFNDHIILTTKRLPFLENTLIACQNRYCTYVLVFFWLNCRSNYSNQRALCVEDSLELKVSLPFASRRSVMLRNLRSWCTGWGNLQLMLCIAMGLGFEGHQAMNLT